MKRTKENKTFFISSLFGDDYVGVVDGSGDIVKHLYNGVDIISERATAIRYDLYSWNYERQEKKCICSVKTIEKAKSDARWWNRNLRRSRATVLLYALNNSGEIIKQLM